MLGALLKDVAGASPGYSRECDPRLSSHPASESVRD